MLPLNYSKVIISYLCQCFIAHEEVCGVSYFNLVIYLWQTFTNGLVAYTSAYPIILQKELANGVPSPELITTLTISFTFLPLFISKQFNRHSSTIFDYWKSPKDLVSHGLCKQRLGGVSYQCVNKRERWMICLDGRNNILHGSRSWKSGWQGG